MKIKRADLIHQLADEYGYTKKKAANIVDDFTSLIINNLEQGNSVLVRNLGCFDLLVRKERSCPNPVTGEKVIIPEHYIPRFYPSNRMRIAVKKWEDNVKRGLA